MSNQSNNSEPTVTIPQSEYNYLLEQSELLSCLEACGVDNWQPGYSDAQEMMEEEE